MMEKSLYDICKTFAGQATKEAFLQKYPGYFFLGVVPTDIPDIEPDFHTGITSSDLLKAKMEEFKETDRLRPGSFLVPIQKKEENEWLLWMSVGRTRNNDVVLRHASVSKLHARLYTEEEGDDEGEIKDEDLDDSPQYRISDTGSSLGTWVNGKKLARSESCRLFCGDLIKFGDIECYFLDSDNLYEKLSK